MTNWMCTECASPLNVDEVYADLQITCDVCHRLHRFVYINHEYRLHICAPTQEPRTPLVVDEGGEVVVEDDSPHPTEQGPPDEGTDIVPPEYKARAHEGPQLLWSSRDGSEPTSSQSMSSPTPRHLPMARADCVNESRPCPYVSCRHHLALTVDANGVSETFPNTIDDLVLSGPLRSDGWFSANQESRVVEGPHFDAMPNTCSLDVVDEHGDLTLSSVAYLMNVSRERVRQLEVKAMYKLRRHVRHLKEEGE